MRTRKAQAVLSIVCILALSIASLAGCQSKRETGAAVGAGAGAVIGANVGEGGWTGAAIGAVIGGLAGYVVGDYMERRDRQQVAQTLEHQPSGTTTQWKNPDTGVKWQATPDQAYKQQGEIYRDVDLKADVDGDGAYEKQSEVTAYRRSDGKWEFVEK
jgi:surface antigen